MYFLSDDEKRFIARRLAPQARRQPVTEDLRGWNWERPPLEPIYATRLALHEVAAQYCPTARDLYLRRVLTISVPPSPAMAAGGYLHRVLSAVVLTAKRVIYGAEDDPLAALVSLASPRLPAGRPGQGPTPALVDQAVLLWHYEYLRIVARVQDVLTQQPHIGVDALVAAAIPVVVEQRLDGNFLGLARGLSIDGFLWSQQMVLDIKFGPKEPFHRLGLAGYALVLESLYECPVDLGCLVYVSFDRAGVRVEREFHVLDDELRQWFIESRDERARLVEEEIDPGLPDVSPADCPYFRVCHPD